MFANCWNPLLVFFKASPSTADGAVWNWLGGRGARILLFCTAEKCIVLFNAVLREQILLLCGEMRGWIFSKSVKVCSLHGKSWRPGRLTADSSLPMTIVIIIIGTRQNFRPHTMVWDPSALVGLLAKCGPFWPAILGPLDMPDISSTWQTQALCESAGARSELSLRLAVPKIHPCSETQPPAP